MYHISLSIAISGYSIYIYMCVRIFVVLRNKSESSLEDVFPQATSIALDLALDQGSALKNLSGRRPPADVYTVTV